MDEEFLFLSSDFNLSKSGYNVYDDLSSSETKSSGSPSSDFLINSVQFKHNSTTLHSQSYSSDDDYLRFENARENNTINNSVNHNGNISHVNADDVMTFDTDCLNLRPKASQPDSTFTMFSPAKHFDLFAEFENEDFQISDGCGVELDCGFQAPKATTDHERPKVEETRNTTLFNGVLNHRHTLRPNLSRIKPVATVTSCGTILRHSASMPNTRLAMSRMKMSRGFTAPETKDGNKHKYHNCSDRENKQSPHLSSKSSLSSGTYSPLEDHRYYARLKRSESPPPSKRRNFMVDSNTSNDRYSTSTERSNCNGSINGKMKMSILETFLRATGPLDPNKGSNAALATEGMLNLCIEESKVPSVKHSLSNTGNNNLLKKLLTGEMDHTDVDKFECLNDSFEILSSSPLCDRLSFSADLFLTDTFGLDAGISVDESGNLNIDSYKWQDESLGSLLEFEESIKQQDQQDNLCLQHYTSNYL